MSKANEQFVGTALTLQRHLRFATIGSVIFPVVTMILIIGGFASWTILSALIFCPGMVFATLHQKYGDRSNWWWLRRGPVITVKTFSELSDARRWIGDSLYDVKEVYPACFKFYEKSQAMHFKLIWG